MLVNDSGITSLPAKLHGNAPKDASISFKSPPSKDYIGKLVTFNVESKIKGDLFLIKGPTGKTIEAEIKPAPQVGSSITVAFKSGGSPKIVSIQQQVQHENVTQNLNKSADNNRSEAKNGNSTANTGQNSGK